MAGPHLNLPSAILRKSHEEWGGLARRQAAKNRQMWHALVQEDRTTGCCFLYSLITFLCFSLPETAIQLECHYWIQQGKFKAINFSYIRKCKVGDQSDPSLSCLSHSPPQHGEFW